MLLFNTEFIQQLIAESKRFFKCLLCVLVATIVIVRFNVHSASETNGFSVSILFYHISYVLLDEYGTSFM